MKKINIYLIARIAKENHSWTNDVVKYLRGSFTVFVPKDNNPWGKNPKTFSQKVFATDLAAIKKSNIGLMLPEYGNDCAWEAGWYAGTQKPLIIFVNSQLLWLRDWMVKGGAPYIITNNKKSLKILRADPILQSKQIIFIKNMDYLNSSIEKIYKQTVK